VIHEGRVVPEITPSNVDKFRIGGSTHTDVTGGMVGKIGELLALAKMGISSDIFHADRISDFLDKKSHGGTEYRRFAWMGIGRGEPATIACI
jgi:isopentenyl phosphate kinase